MLSHPHDTHFNLPHRFYKEQLKQNLELRKFYIFPLGHTGLTHLLWTLFNSLTQDFQPDRSFQTSLWCHCPIPVKPKGIHCPKPVTSSHQAGLLPLDFIFLEAPKKGEWKEMKESNELVPKAPQLGQKHLKNNNLCKFQKFRYVLLSGTIGLFQAHCVLPHYSVSASYNKEKIYFHRKDFQEQMHLGGLF